MSHTQTESETCMTDTQIVSKTCLGGRGRLPACTSLEQDTVNAVQTTRPRCSSQPEFSVAENRPAKFAPAN